jgi:hypothetical protein
MTMCSKSQSWAVTLVYMQLTYLVSITPSTETIDIGDMTTTHLIIDRPEVNICFERFTCDPTSKHVLPGITKSVVNEDPRYILDLALVRLANLQKVGTYLGSTKGCPVLQFAIKNAGL